ncbi:MAG: DUF1800 family protein, partial [Acidimicrobiia bacterium]
MPHTLRTSVADDAGMVYSKQEQISHVARRLGFGVEPAIIMDAASTDDAIATALDTSTPTPPAQLPDPPTDLEDARSPEQRSAPSVYWFTQMISGPNRIEERLAWFWHDHFSTSVRKVKVPYLMFKQHITIRNSATGNFRDLLYDVATDAAMLLYLDGAKNTKDAINENFGREVMELFTMGRGNYTEADVVAASRAFSGWVVPRGPRARERGLDLWTSTFVPFRHDDGMKTFLGNTGALDTGDAIDVILDQEATALFIGSKLYSEIVGFAPDAVAVERVATAFRKNYEIMDLVEAIVSDPMFVSETSIQSKVRTPIERAVGIAQAFGYEAERATQVRGQGNTIVRALERLGYLPFNPPNVAGYAKGHRLLGPFSLVHGFDLAGLIPPDVEGFTGTEL